MSYKGVLCDPGQASFHKPYNETYAEVQDKTHECACGIILVMNEQNATVCIIDLFITKDIH